jgi:hypothetical protein
MKFITLIALAALSTATFSAEIKATRVNSETKSIEIDVAYGGGCEKHDFKLEIGACLESYPVQCFAELKHDSNGDFCEAYIQETLSFSIKELGLDDEYYELGSIDIIGDNNTRKSISLPELTPTFSNKVDSKYSEGSRITVQHNGIVPGAPKGLKWELKAVLESYPAQYVYVLVKK